MESITDPSAPLEYARLGGVTFAAVGVMYFILARYGVGGLFGFGERWRFLPLQFRGGLGLNQPWRFLAAVAITLVGLMGGYRSVPITLIILGAFLFFLEGLHRTRLAPMFLFAGILAFALIIPFADRMPFTIQRSLSFLPIGVSALAKETAEDSSDWRLRIWREVIPTIPQYLLVGKGYGIDPREMEMQMDLAGFKTDSDGDGAIRASDFHNGPLSLIIPLGIFGAIGFLWFMVAGFLVMLNNYRHGDPVHQGLNRFLLAFFVTKALFFFVIYGSFQNDLSIFTGVVALSATINGGVRKPAPSTKPNPAYLPFRMPKPLRA
jgi:O-antigen ligase